MPSLNRLEIYALIKANPPPNRRQMGSGRKSYLLGMENGVKMLRHT